MHGLSKNLLTIFLSLLLSVCPLQSAFASFFSDCDHESGMVEPVDNHAGSMSLATEQMSQDCPHCDVVAGCSGQCSSIHYVVAALLPATSYTVQPVTLPTLPDARGGVVSQIPSLLFRPPRT